jgi:hypothetical protein
MKSRPHHAAAVLLGALCLLGGCDGDVDQEQVQVDRPSPPTQSDVAQSGRQRPWRTIFNGEGLGGWRLVRGCFDLDDGAIALNHPFCGMSIVFAEKVSFRDGEVEVTLLPIPTSRPMQPYVIALRSRVSFNWSSLYFTCYPDHLEVARGSARSPNPPAEMTVYYEPVPDVVVWRFLLQGSRIDVYRLGVPVATYYDWRPQRGTIAIGTDGWGLHVLRVRVRTADEE